EGFDDWQVRTQIKRDLGDHHVANLSGSPGIAIRPGVPHAERVPDALCVSGVQVPDPVEDQRELDEQESGDDPEYTASSCHEGVDGIERIHKSKVHDRKSPLAYALVV